MSVSSLGGVWMFGPQTAKEAAASTFYETRLIAANGGPIDLVEPMPPELGGIPIVDGAHRLAGYYGSTVDLIPRLEEDLGWLLFAACGDVSTVSDSPESGLNTHYFRMSSSDYLALKWLTLRRQIPSEDGAASSGVQSLDTRIGTIVFNFTAASRLTARMAMLGRVPSYSDNVTGWTYNSAEDATSVGITSTTGSYFKIAEFQAGNLPVSTARVTLGNSLSQPQQEFILGSPHPDDIIGLYRNLMAEVVYKWEDEDLYLELCTNGGTGASIAWTNTIFTGSLALKTTSDANISGKNYPYSLEVYAPNVYWYPSAPPAVAGINLISLPLVGLVARSVVSDTFQFRLVNEVASYTWPT